jgi:hypothetical protein
LPVRVAYQIMGEKPEINVPPPVRLIPKMNTINQSMPDYYLGYEDEKTGVFVQLMENNQPVVIQGAKVMNELRMNSNRNLLYENKDAQ